MKIIIINGPNLNLVGIREQEIYGEQDLPSYLESLRKRFPQLLLDYFQSNVEGELINKLHEVGFTYEGILLNAGGYTHTSVALADAIKAIKAAVIEVHISNIYAREDFRHKSLLSRYSIGVIAGFGLEGYALAIQVFLGKMLTG